MHVLQGRAAGKESGSDRVSGKDAGAGAAAGCHTGALAGVAGCEEKLDTSRSRAAQVGEYTTHTYRTFQPPAAYGDHYRGSNATRDVLAGTSDVSAYVRVDGPNPLSQVGFGVFYVCVFFSITHVASVNHFLPCLATKHSPVFIFFFISLFPFFTRSTWACMTMQLLSIITCFAFAHSLSIPFPSFFTIRLLYHSSPLVRLAMPGAHGRV
jgi:hypothetical protein